MALHSRCDSRSKLEVDVPAAPRLISMSTSSLLTHRHSTALPCRRAMLAAANQAPERIEPRTPIAAPPRSRQRPHGRTPTESAERGGARGGLAARERRRTTARDFDLCCCCCCRWTTRIVMQVGVSERLICVGVRYV